MVSREHLQKDMKVFLILGITFAVLVFGRAMGGETFALSVLVLVGFYCMFFPEIAFALFLNAGMYKGDPRLELPEPLDWTAFFAIVSVVAIVVNAVRRKNVLVFPPRLLYLPYGMMALLAAISVTYTANPVYGQEKLLRFATLTAFALFGAWFILVTQERITRFFFAVILLSTVIVVDSVFVERLQPGEVGFYAFSSGYLGMGRIAGEATLILLFYFLLYAKSNRQKVFILAAAALNAFGVIVAAAKGPMVALGTTMVIATLYSLTRVIARSFLPRYETREHVKIVAAFGGFAALGALLVVTRKEYFLTLTYRAIEFLSGTSFGQSERVEFYRKAIDAMTSFPTALTGLGFGGFGKGYRWFGVERGFAHSIFLELGSELGLVGLAAFLVLIYGAVMTIVPRLRSQEGRQYLVGVALLTLLCYECIHFSFHGDINDARVLYTWLGASFAYGAHVVRKASNDGYKKKKRLPLSSPPKPF